MAGVINFLAKVRNQKSIYCKVFSKTSFLRGGFKCVTINQMQDVLSAAIYQPVRPVRHG